MKTLNFEEMEVVQGGFDPRVPTLETICGLVGLYLDTASFDAANFGNAFIWYQANCV